jgi:hypothetical protein
VVVVAAAALPSLLMLMMTLVLATATPCVCEEDLGFAEVVKGLGVAVVEDVRVCGRGATFDGGQSGLHGAPASFEGLFAGGAED